MTRLFSRGLLLASLCVAACDIPTGPPKWDSTFVVQGEGTTLSVGQLLPSSVTLANNAFVLSLSPSTFSQNLGVLCGATCTALNGTTAPKPAFTGNMNTTINLPADVVTATLTSGSVNLNIQNGFSFDPVRPSATAVGSIAISITSGGATIGSSTITSAIPAGTSTQVSIPLTGQITGPLSVALVVTSPAGDPAPINTASNLTVVATPTNLNVSTASVRVQNRNVNATQVSLDVSGIDQTIVDHLKEGAFILAINNPFSVTGTLTLTVSGPGVNITKPITLASGQSTVEVAFSQAELKQILGKQGITMRISGPVNSANNVTVTPAQVLSVTSKLRLVVNVGGN